MFANIKKAGRYVANKIEHFVHSKTAQVAAAGTGVTLLSSPARAAVDITAATAGITEAGVAILAIVGALLALSVSIYGIVKVYNFMSKKAGA